MNAMYGGWRKSGVTALPLGDPSTLQKKRIQVIQISWSDSCQRFLPQVGIDVVVDVPPVSLQGVTANRSPHALIQPFVQPFGESHPALLCQFHPPIGVDVLVELGGQVLLCVGIDVPEDRFAVFLMTHHDTALPAPVIPFAHHAVPRRSAFCHLLFTSGSDIAVVVIHALYHQPDTQPEAQDEILDCCDAVDLKL